jgi:hypothetical protein
MIILEEMTLTKRWFTTVIKEPSQSIRVPKDFYTTELNYVQFGRKVLPCHIIPSDGTEFQINVDVWKELGLPDQTYFRFIQEGSTLRLLPLIGLFTPHFKRGAKEPLGMETAIQRKWLKMTQDMGGVAFLFDGKNMNQEEGTLEGWVFSDGKWSQMELPLPDVVYDRTPNRYVERLPHAIRIKALFEKDYEIPWFNNGFFDKWVTHKLLEEDNTVKAYLPETQVYNKHQLFNMLERYDFLYLKPRNKSKGVGVVSIQADEGGYLIKSYHQQQLITRHARTITDVWKAVHDLVEEPNKYIIQEGVRLFRYQDHPVDFRVHTNKDCNGHWQLSAIAGKRAGAEQLTTHLAYGGTVIPLTKLFNHEQQIEQLEHFKAVAIHLSEALSRKIGGAIGELGFDLGMDQRGRIWMFEVNSKPRHHIFLSPSIRQQLKTVHHYWFDYSQFLASYENE